MRLLNSFYVNCDIMYLFYTYMIESIVCYNISLWWSSTSESDKKILNRITKQAAKVTQCNITSVDDLYCKIVTKKVKCILLNSTHPLQQYYTSMRSGTRLRAISCRTQRYRKYIIPNSIYVFNNSDVMFYPYS